MTKCELPKGCDLPEGWTATALCNSGWDRFLVITAPKIGAVTVDFQFRGFRLGIVTTGRFSSEQTYHDRGWRVALCEAAIAKLKAA